MPLGSHTEIAGTIVRNEDLSKLTFADASIDLIIHADVVEHIPDSKAVFAETARVLRPGGKTIFTAPFFQKIDQTVVRAVVEQGQIRHLLSAELHGDPISPAGILAFYNLGWDLLELIRKAGLTNVATKMIYAPQLGLVSNGCPDPKMNMMPFYIEAQKPGLPRQGELR